MKVLWFFLERKNFFLQKEAKTLIHTSQSLVGQGGFEPPTPRLSSVCSNQLSYWPNTSEQAERDASTKTDRDAPEPARLVAGKGYVDGAQSGSDQSDRHRHPPAARDPNTQACWEPVIGNHPKHPASRMTSGQFLERR
jgi:hypothetical protein